MPSWGLAGTWETPDPSAPQLSGATGCLSCPPFPAPFLSPSPLPLTGTQPSHVLWHILPFSGRCVSVPSPPLLPTLPFLFCARELGHWPDIWGLSAVAARWGAQTGDAWGRFTRRGCGLSSRLDTRCDQHDTDTCLLRDRTHFPTQSKGQTSAC